MLPPRSARLSATEEEEGQATEPRLSVLSLGAMPSSTILVAQSHFITSP